MSSLWYKIKLYKYIVLKVVRKNIVKNSENNTYNFIWYIACLFLTTSATTGHPVCKIWNERYLRCSQLCYMNYGKHSRLKLTITCKMGSRVVVAVNPSRPLPYAPKFAWFGSPCQPKFIYYLCSCVCHKKKPLVLSPGPEASRNGMMMKGIASRPFGSVNKEIAEASGQVMKDFPSLKRIQCK